jgi:hypothetical protein
VQAIVELTSPPAADGLEARENGGRLGRVRSRAHAKIDLGPGNAEFPEEDLGHVLVVVLSRMHQHRVNARLFRAQGPIVGSDALDERPDFHEVRPGTRHDDQLQAVHGQVLR